MTATTEANPPVGIFLDAAAPLLEPRSLKRRLPAVRAGGVDALLATVGAIEDFTTTMEVVSRWLELDRGGGHEIRIARSVADIRTPKQQARPQS
jgi:membrane dipeptidase